MPRILVRDEWFESLSPSSLYEIDFENLLLERAADLYPTFHMVPFKKRVTSEYGVGIPDLALVDKEYRSWWVVEVELGVHPLRQHVEQQVKIFASAEYGEAEASYLAGRSEGQLEIEMVRAMLLGTQPKVLVLVNQIKPAWSSTLRRWDAIVGVVELFRSFQNEMVMRVNGDHPDSLGELVSRCRIDPLLRGSLKVASPAALGVPPGDRVSIWYEGALTDWVRQDAADTVWLMPAGRFPLEGGVRSFLLKRASDGRLRLEAGGYD